MKKFFMMFVALMLISTATFAGENDYSKIKEIDNTTAISYSLTDNVNLNYNFQINYINLGKYLQLSEEDLFDVRTIHESFCEGMMLASKAESVDSRNRIICNAIDYELRLMKTVLSTEQYRKFLRVLNISLNNRGFAYITMVYNAKERV